MIEHHYDCADANPGRERLIAFVRAHDIDPNDVPERGTVTTHLGKVTIPVFVRDADGRFLADKEAVVGVKTTTVTVRQVRRWPK